MDAQSFVKVEEKYNLNKKSVYGINYWVYSRFLIESMLAQMGDANKVKSAKGQKKTAKKILRLLARCVVGKVISPKKAKILIYNHPRRVIDKQGQYICCYTSWLYKLFEDCVMVEAPYNYTHEKLIPENNIFYTDYAEVLSTIKAHTFKCIRIKSYNKLYKQIEGDVTAALQELVGDNETIKRKIIDLLVFRTLLIKYRHPYLKRIVDCVNPQVIIEVVSYSLNSMIINEIAKEKGIPTIEMQHGIVGEYHIAYNYGEKSETIRQFPDYLFVFGEYWKNIVKPPIMDDKVRVVGYPFFEENVKEYSNSAQNHRGICFISQAPIGVALSKFAVGLTAKVLMDGWNVYYKLHPAEYNTWRDDYPWLENSGITVVGKGDMGLYEVFSKCSVQIGVYSTAIYEGIGFGLKTLIYRDYMSDVFEDLAKRGYAQYVEDINECIEAMKGIEGNNVKEELWAMNAKERVFDEINEVLLKHNA